MENVITLGKRLLPVEQIALVEPFDPTSNPDFKPEKEFKARVVLLNRDTVLTEVTPQEFAKDRGFRILTEDNVAANPAIAFSVESFEPTESFKPTKPYLTRLKWRDQEGNEQSKLLLTKPETVLALVLRQTAAAPSTEKKAAKRPARAHRMRGFGSLKPATA
jgi:hypothetical protein